MIIVMSRLLAEEAAYGSTSKHFLSLGVKSSRLKPPKHFLSPKGTNATVIIVTPVIIVTSRLQVEEAAYGLNLQAPKASLEGKPSELSI